MSGASIPVVLRERASLQPNEPAFTFIEYGDDPAGSPETLTWLQTYRRSRTVAAQLREHGATGDRAVILAPQGLDYVIAFLGALEAGFVAVPLSMPTMGVHDDRVSSVLADSSPAAILTTSAGAGNVTDYVRQHEASAAAAVVEVDALDFRAATATARRDPHDGIALLQYTSGSTRQPAGVMVGHRNLVANFEQVMAGYFADTGNLAPPETTVVSWLPFYHDMGLFIGVCAPILGGLHSVLTSPMAFLARPARWMQLMATNTRVFSPAPNFGFELAVRRTSDADMGGLDLGGVTHILCGAERVHAATLERFTERFARFHLRPAAIRPSYGLAEATVYVAARAPGEPPNIVYFGTEKLCAGHAERCFESTGTALVSYGVPSTPMVRIVDPDAKTEQPAGTVGEIWVHGGNVAMGYWKNADKNRETFGVSLLDPSAGTPAADWLRTGDLGVISEGELFIVGRIKDLVIVDGRNHYPDDIEATVQEITGGRVAAISVAGARREKLAVVVEYKKRGDSPEDIESKIEATKRSVTAALSTRHGITVADLVLVAPGSIPITTSGKIRRGACAEQYGAGQLTRI